MLADSRDTSTSLASAAVHTANLSAALKMTDALTNPAESRPPKPDIPPVTTTAWTDRFKESGKPAEYRLFDQIWLSPALSGRLTDSEINRRSNLTGDGSDHDPAWVRLSL